MCIEDNADSGIIFIYDAGSIILIMIAPFTTHKNELHKHNSLKMTR